MELVKEVIPCDVLLVAMFSISVDATTDVTDTSDGGADDDVQQCAICPSRHFCPADSAACLVKARLRHGSRYYHLAQCLH